MTQGLAQSVVVTTIANLPPAARRDQLFLVTDALTYGDIATGGGTIKGLVVFNENETYQWIGLVATVPVGGSGTLNTIPLWTPDGVTLGDSIMAQISGKIAVGTVSPLSLFHVYEAVNGAITYPLSVRNAFVGLNSGAGMSFFGGDANPRVQIGYVRDSGLSSRGEFFVKTGEGASIAERLRVTYDGRFGFGTASPDELMHLLGASGTAVFLMEDTGAGIAGWTVKNTAAEWSGFINAAGQFILGLTGSGVNEILVDDATGNVTIAKALLARRKMDTLTSNTTIDTTYGNIELDASGGAFTATLPASPSDGDIYHWSKVDGDNLATLDGNGKDINGSATVAISAQYTAFATTFSETLDEWRVE